MRLSKCKNKTKTKKNMGKTYHNYNILVRSFSQKSRPFTLNFRLFIPTLQPFTLKIRRFIVAIRFFTLKIRQFTLKHWSFTLKIWLFTGKFEHYFTGNFTINIRSNLCGKN